MFGKSCRQIFQTCGMGTINMYSKRVKWIEKNIRMSEDEFFQDKCPDNSADLLKWLACYPENHLAREEQRNALGKDISSCHQDFVPQIAWVQASKSRSRSVGPSRENPMPAGVVKSASDQTQ